MSEQKWQKWPKRITIVWPFFDYPRIADPESAGLEEDEKRIYILAPLKKRKRTKRRAGR